MPNSLYEGLDAVLLVMREERPSHAGALIGSGDGRAVVAASGETRCEPPTPIARLRIAPAARGSGAVHESCAQIAVAACADPEAPWRASRRVFPGDQPEPGRKLAAVREPGRNADGRQDGGGTDGSNPRQGLQPLTCGMGSTDGRQLLIIRRERFSRLRYSSYSGQKTSVLSALSVACSFCRFDTSNGRNVVMPWGKTIPYACSSPRSSCTRAVRAFMSRSRTRYRAWGSCGSGCFMGTKRLVGRLTASQMASATRASCFGDLTDAFQWWGDQPHLMTMLADTSGPRVGTPTGFHAHA
jgi:hypothetical protein